MNRQPRATKAEMAIRSAKVWELRNGEMQYNSKQIATLLGLNKGQVENVLYKETNDRTSKIWKANHPNYFKNRYDSIKEKWISVDDTCAICGAVDKLTRHHIDPFSKSFAMKELYNQGAYWTDEFINAEKEKTVVLCKSCHRKLHIGSISYPSLWDGKFTPEINRFDDIKRRREENNDLYDSFIVIHGDQTIYACAEQLGITYNRLNGIIKTHKENDSL